ncbi:MAG: glycosyltransferase family 39 protein [Clostridia bacterium]|nr:glycosyltransferase family 39 protein [Clostridia bacterium]
MSEKKAGAIIKANKTGIFAFIVILVGIAVRVAGFGSLPGGFNQDEAYAAYEAYSLLNWGMDSSGYAFPTYFVSWGSGMNVLESYLAIPFMAVLGCEEWVFRLPQLILSLISLPVMYLMLKRMFSSKVAIVGLCMMVISPWHILLSRWGLESNLAPHFLLFGMYFLTKSVDNDKNLCLAALMYGLAMYCYSMVWLTVPLTVGFCGIYLLATKTKIRPRIIVSSICILFVLALPHILFVLINSDIIPEIRTPFLSIPRLVVSRDNEIDPMHLFQLESWQRAFDIIVNQSDGLVWNSAHMYGLYYGVSVPFLALGFAKMVYDSVKSIIKGEFSFSVILGGVWLLSLVACIVMNYDLNVNRMNSVHFLSLILIANGIVWPIDWLKKLFSMKVLYASAVGLMFIASFGMFSNYYFTDYNDSLHENFRHGMAEAMEFAKESDFEEIKVDLDICFALVLYYDRTDVRVFRETVVYNNYPAAFMNVKQFSNYEFINYGSSAPKGEGIHIILSQRAEAFRKVGHTVVDFGNVSVAYKAP